MNNTNGQQYTGTPGIRVITVSQQYGSGGSEIAAWLAQRLGWQLFDDKLVALVAQEVELTEEEVEVYDERVDSFAARLLVSMPLATPELLAGNPPLLPQIQQRLCHGAVRRIIEQAANIGNAVIVGRGAQMQLADRRDVFHLRVVAPLERRVRSVIQREGLDEDRARARIQQKDRQYARYLQTCYGRSVNDVDLYDLMINSSILDMESLVDQVCLALERTERQLRLECFEQLSKTEPNWYSPGAAVMPVAREYV